MAVVKVSQCHDSLAVGTTKRIVTKRSSYVIAPFCETANEFMPVFWDGTPEFFVIFTVPGIEAIITDHFVMRLRYVLDQ